MDQARIDPLTISDSHSRYLLRCQAVGKTNTVQVRAMPLNVTAAEMQSHDFH